MAGLLLWLVRRLAFALLTLLVVAVLTYGVPRALFPERFPGTTAWDGTWHEIGRGFLHFDWGNACGWAGCPAIKTMFAREFANDLWLIGGALVIGVSAGMLGAMWCARRPRTRRARVVEAMATSAYCTPVYLIGLVLLILFNSTFGVIEIPAFFNGEPAWEHPWTDPWVWLKTFLVPWLVLGAPIAAMCLRLTLRLLYEEEGALHVQTAIAKGVSPRKVMSRHIAPVSYVQTASFVSVSIPPLVINLILVEAVFSVPGFFKNLRIATGVIPNYKGYPTVDYAMVQAISMWAAVMIVALGIILDLVIIRMDPRVRAAGLPI